MISHILLSTLKENIPLSNAAQLVYCEHAVAVLEELKPQIGHK